MKVLFVHNFYQSSSPSGEDSVYRNELALLKGRGVEVMRYERHNDWISGTRDRAKAAFDLVWSKKTYREVSELIKREKPDIAHFHNIWYLISPSAYAACKDAGVPVVQTLHNFRMFCANGLLLRDGRVCEACLGKYPWRSAVYGCYRDSRAYSLPVAVAEGIHKARRTWTRDVDAFISLTGFGKSKFIQCGIPEDRIFVKPNFLPDPPDPDFDRNEYAVFIGRLSREKGVGTLIDAFNHLSGTNDSLLTLKIVGEGPLRGEIGKKITEKKLGKVIECAGGKGHSECMEILGAARFLVMPAVCYENFPLTILEAFANGKPVIASRLGAMAALIDDRKTGLLFEAGDPSDLASKIAWMAENEAACKEMGRNARAEFEEKYTAGKNFEVLMEIYEKVLKR